MDAVALINKYQAILYAVTFLMGWLKIGRWMGVVDTRLRNIESSLNDGKDTFTRHEASIQRATEDTARIKGALGLPAVILLIVLLLGCVSAAFGQESKPLEPLKWDNGVELIARRLEAQYKFPHGICHAFAEKENSGRIRRAKPRVEKGFFNAGERHYKQVCDTAAAFLMRHPDYGIPFDIERFQEATSWGPWQELGINLRAFGCEIEYFANMTVRQFAEHWARFFADYIRRYKTLERAVKFYNGPAAPASYVRDILKYREQFNY